MTRREMLVRLFGAVAAAAVAPLVNLEDATAAFWNQPPIQELLKWKLVFPDGNVLQFNACVVSEEFIDERARRLTIRPYGPTIINAGPAMEPQAEAQVFVGDAPIGVLREVGLPAMPVDDGGWTTGLRRPDGFTVTIKF